MTVIDELIRLRDQLQPKQPLWRRIGRQRALVVARHLLQQGQPLADVAEYLGTSWGYLRSLNLQSSSRHRVGLHGSAQTLLSLALAGQARPTDHSTLAQAHRAYVAQDRISYQDDYVQILKLIRPDWLDDKRIAAGIARRGYKHSVSALRKMSAASKGRKIRSGFTHTDDTKAKIGLAHKGMKRSDHTKANISAAMKGREAHNKGKAASDSQKLKQRAAMTGRKLTDQHRANISSGQTGRKQSAATVARRAASHRGMRRGADARLNISIGRLKNDEALWAIVLRAIQD